MINYNLSMRRVQGIIFFYFSRRGHSFLIAWNYPQLLISCMLLSSSSVRIEFPYCRLHQYLVSLLCLWFLRPKFKLPTALDLEHLEAFWAHFWTFTNLIVFSNEITWCLMQFSTSFGHYVFFLKPIVVLISGWAHNHLTRVSSRRI